MKDTIMRFEMIACRSVIGFAIFLGMALISCRYSDGFVIVQPPAVLTTLSTAQFRTQQRCRLVLAAAKGKKRKSSTKKSSGGGASSATKGFGSAIGSGTLSDLKNKVETDTSSQARNFYTWLENGDAGSNLKRTSLGYFRIGATDDASEDEEGFRLRGVVAVQDVKKGDAIINIPYELAVNLGQQGEDPTLPAVTFLRDFCTCMITNGARKPYYEMLPPFGSDDCLGSTDFFSERALEELQSPMIVRETLLRKQRVKQRYDSDIVTDSGFPTWIDGSPVTVEHLQWAVWIVTSRVLTVQGSDGQSYRILIPYLDMCNHDRSSQHVLTGRATGGGELKIVAGTNVKIGQQINILYGGGVAGNDRFVQDYGFLDTTSDKRVAKNKNVEEAYRIVAQQLLGKVRVKEGIYAGKTIPEADREATLRALRITSMKDDESLLLQEYDDPAIRTAISYRLGVKRALSEFIIVP